MILINYWGLHGLIKSLNKKNKMTTYSSKTLTEYLDSVASEKKISREELGKNIFINDFSVARSPSLIFGFLKAERDFRETVKKYDAIINIKRSFNPGYLGLTCEYKISAIGVKFEEN